MLLRLCEVRPYAAYGSENHRQHIHRQHIHRLHIVLRTVLYAAILQNADAAHSYIIVHANNVSDSEIAGEEKALRQYVCSATACLPYYQLP